jgi:hypothetical protein
MDWYSVGTYDSWADCVAAGNSISDAYSTWDCRPSGGHSSGPPYDLMVFEAEE